ncbi:MAG: hypothetical protein HQ592_07870 [Planctomycetes bacterium]|nr:hypothetical protein [Planctomycetota bacterium]
MAPFDWHGPSSTLRLAAAVAGDSVDVLVREGKKLISVTLTSHNPLSRKAKQQVVSGIRRSLGLDIDTGELLSVARSINSQYEQLVRRGVGRMLRSYSLWEDAAKTLFTTNCSWALTRKMAALACSSHLSLPTPSGAYPFPLPETLAGHSPEELRELLPVGYRAEYLHHLCKRFVEDPTFSSIENNRLSREAAYQAARSLLGFGPYAADHLMLTMGYFDQIPVDCEVTAYIKRNHATNDVAEFIRQRYEPWGEFRWWGFKMDRMTGR